MAGNSRRAGAVRRPGTKKQPQIGSGGRGRKSMAGRGPTPKASERQGHPAQRRAVAAERRAGGGRRRVVGRGTGRPGDDLVLGRNAVLEALEAGMPSKLLIVQAGVAVDRRIRSALAIASGRGIAVSEVSRSDLDDRAHGVVHQGIALQAERFRYADGDDVLASAREGRGRLIALDGITDPRNLGAIIRSAGAFGFNGVIVPARRAAHVTPVVWRSSAGAVARVPIAIVTNVTKFVQRAQADGFLAVGLDADGNLAVDDVRAVDRPVVLVVGSEGKGLGSLLGRTCDILARIPMAPGAESLNASVAAAIAMRELGRAASGSSPSADRPA